MSGIPAGAGSLLGKRLGKFEILALLALGGTAEIYLARIGGAAGFEKYVVVKCLHDHLADDPEFVKMFLDEARLAAHLDHSNIVQTMELGEHENRYYMVMEFLAGLSLAMVVRRAAERLPGGKIPVPLVLNMMAQACAGLHYAHERSINGKVLNIVHRDISPQNLVVSFEGVVKVVDFGIAKAELRETKTRSGTIKGKFAYMSPEQCVANNVDRRTDVFALGVIAHELLTGRRLFKRNSPYETYQAVIECAVAPPSKMNVELDPTFDALIMKAVAKDPDARYPTAEAFGDALLSYLHHRAKGSGPGDVGRFFDVSFAQEIDEHGARMRELISGRDVAGEAAMGWGEEDEDKKRNETVDLGGMSDDKSMALDTADLMSVDRPIVESIDDEAEPADESDMPAEKTRIESNPLERMAELEASMQKGKPGAAPATPNAPTLPAQAPAAAKARPVMPPSGPLPLPAPPSGPVPPGTSPRASAARFPNLSHLPTQIADASTPPEQGHPDEVDPDDPQLGRATVLQSPQNGTPQPPSQANLPSGYPVMNPRMSEQMMSGNVYPSEPYGGARPSAQTPSVVADSGPRAVQTGPHGVQHAASLMSPVGQQYPQQVDWAEAAAAPARALPPWMLAVLFIGAIGIALTITIVIARIIR